MAAFTLRNIEWTTTLSDGSENCADALDMQTTDFSLMNAEETTIKLVFFHSKSYIIENRYLSAGGT
jgi:hypothetical protein